MRVVRFGLAPARQWQEVSKPILLLPGPLPTADQQVRDERACNSPAADTDESIRGHEKKSVSVLVSNISLAIKAQPRPGHSSMMLHRHHIRALGSRR